MHERLIRLRTRNLFKRNVIEDEGSDFDDQEVIVTCTSQRAESQSYISIPWTRAYGGTDALLRHKAKT